MEAQSVLNWIGQDCLCKVIYDIFLDNGMMAPVESWMILTEGRFLIGALDRLKMSHTNVDQIFVKKYTTSISVEIEQLMTVYRNLDSDFGRAISHCDKNDL